MNIGTLIGLVVAVTIVSILNERMVKNFKEKQAKEQQEKKININLHSNLPIEKKSQQKTKKNNKKK